MELQAPRLNGAGWTLTDDGHLGQILSYLASTEAKTVVWIATGFREPHRAAVRWLNANTAEAFGFFALRLRVVRMDSGSDLTFEVIEHPVGWAPAPSRPRDEAQTGVGGFAAAFWAAHLESYPDEAKLSRSVGERCHWRASRPPGVVIGQRVQEHGLSVFLRGRYGVTLATVEEALRPFAGQLEDRLCLALRGERPALLAETSLDIDVTKPANWSKGSKWLRDRVDIYDIALRELARGSGEAL